MQHIEISTQNCNRNIAVFQKEHRVCHTAVIADLYASIILDWQVEASISLDWQFFITCNVEYLLPVIGRKCLFLLTSLHNIVILSIIVIVRDSVKSTNVVCPHNGTYDLCIFMIFWKKVLCT